jgi:ribosomal protein L44E
MEKKNKDSTKWGGQNKKEIENKKEKKINKMKLRFSHLPCASASIYFS